MSSKTYRRTSSTNKLSGVKTTKVWSAQTGKTKTSYSTKGNSLTRTTWSYGKTGVKRTQTRSNGNGSYTIFTKPKVAKFKLPKSSKKKQERLSPKGELPTSPLGLIIFLIGIAFVALFSK